MGTDEHEAWQDQMTDLQTNFGNGLALLTVLAGRNPATVSQEETLELFAAFEAAYGPLAELQAEGRFEMGGGILLPELREQVTRLGVLLRLPPESAEAEGAALDIRALAEECLTTLAPEAAPPAEPTDTLVAMESASRPHRPLWYMQAMPNEPPDPLDVLVLDLLRAVAVALNAAKPQARRTEARELVERAIQRLEPEREA